MAKKKKKKGKGKTSKSAKKGVLGDNKIKIIIPIIVAVIVIIALVFIFILPEDDNGNGDGNGNQPPLAEFTYSPQVIYANRTVNFNALNSSDPDGDELEYNWNFGDPNATSQYPNTATGAKPSHLYSMPGTYNVTLIVEDGKGGVDDLSVELTVLPEETPTVSLNFLKPNNSITNIVWKLIVDLTEGTDEQLSLTNIRYKIYNGSDTNDIKLEGIVSNLEETNKNIINPYNGDGIYFDDSDEDSVISVGDFFSIAGDGGGTYPVLAGDHFQLIYEPNQGEMTDPEPLP